MMEFMSKTFLFVSFLKMQKHQKFGLKKTWVDAPPLKLCLNTAVVGTYTISILAFNS